MAFKDMVAANTKMLNLWNGTNNDLAPANWYTVGFDDSGWATPATPSSTALKYFSRTVPASIYTSTLPSGPQPIWPTASPQSAYHYAILRWHFALPATYTVNDVVFWIPSDAYGIGFPGENMVASDMALNGTFLPYNLNQPFGITQSAINTNFKVYAVTGDNVFAIHFHTFAVAYNDPAFPLWTSNAWFTARIDLDAAGGRSFGVVIG